MRTTLVIIAVCFAAIIALMVGVKEQKQRAADFVFISSDDLHFLDPQRTSWLVDFRVLQCLYEPLVRYDATGESFEPAAAERWDISEDKKTYTFHLRRDAIWSNGDPVTAADFKFAWFRALMPDFGSAYANMLFCIEGAEDFYEWRSNATAHYAESDTKKTPATAQTLYVTTLEKFDELVGIETPDSHTLRVRLNNPTAYFLELCAFMTLCPNHRASIEQYITAPDAMTGVVAMIKGDDAYFRPDNLITNGPYRLASRRPKRDLMLARSDTYWNHDNVRSESIQMLINDNPLTALLQFQQGEADWWPDIPTSGMFASDLLEGGIHHVHTIPTCGTRYVIFNCQETLPDGSRNPFVDPRVRRAFSMTINRKAIVSSVTRMNQPIARSFVPPEIFPGYKAPVESGAVFDPEAARALLAEAGFPNGEGMPRLPVLFNSGGGHELIFQQMKKTWEEELGVRVELDIKESKNYGVMRRQQNFAIARGGWNGDYSDPTTFLQLVHSADANNHGRWNNPRYDALLLAAERETDPTRRFKLLADAETILNTEQPIAPILHDLSVEMYDESRMKNYTINPMKRRRLDLVEIVQTDEE